MNKNLKKAFPFLAVGAVFLILLVLNLFFQDHWLDSDMAAEMMFSKLLGEENRFIASPNWYYSTEFRVLYTQLIMVPLFKMLTSWHIIRTITNIVFYIVMFLSYLYAVKPLGLKRNTKILSGLILYLPFSETMAQHMQIGNTYMSHVIILFFFFGLYLRIVTQKECKGIKKNMRLLFFMGLALVCGMSGVRYLFTMQCPLMLASLLYLMKSEQFQNFRKKPSRDTFVKIFKGEQIRLFMYSILGGIGAVAGYGVNVLFISKKFVFQTYGATNFISIYYGELFDRLQDAIGTLLMLFGYIPDKGVLSLRGLISVISFVLVGCFVYVIRKTLKREQGIRYFWTFFTVCAFFLNVFVFVFTTSTMVSRYYITILIFAIPVIALYLEKEPYLVDRVIFIAIIAGCLSLCTVKTVYSMMTVDKNAERKQVVEYLENEGYHFGFAIFENANILTELSNGEIEVGNVWDPVKLDYFKWSSPMKYYEEGYAKGEVFLLLSEEECAEYEGAKALSQERITYRENGFVVFVFDNLEELLSCRESEEY